MGWLILYVFVLVAVVALVARSVWASRRRPVGLGRKGGGRQAAKAVPKPTAGEVRFNSAACMMRVAFAVAGCDGRVEEREVALLRERIQGIFKLDEGEMGRLRVLEGTLIGRPADAGSIRELAKGLSARMRQAMGRLVVAIVVADGVVTEEELKAVRVCHSALGFEQERIERTIGELRGKRAVAEKAEAGPTGLKLDRAAIAAIMKDTREVAAMLSEAMSVEEEGAVETPVVAVVEQEDGTVPARYAGLYRVLVGRGEWGMEEAEVEARKQGHMLGGAVEALNEWAAEKYGNPLFIEEAEKLVVDRQILN